MEVQQIYSLINTVTKEVIGDQAIVAEDLSNVVDIGNAVFNTNSFDHYCKSLIDHVGYMVFVNRTYTGYAPNIRKTGWEYGAALQKVSTTLPEAVQNEDWTLQNGVSVDPFLTSIPTVNSKFYQKRVTFEIDRTITEEQLKSAFSSAIQLNAFVSMLFNEIDKSMTIKTDALIMRTINSLMADTLYADYQSGTVFTGASHVKAVNLLYLYNQEFSKTLAADKALTDPDFIRFAIYTMGKYVDRLKSASELFNIGGQVRFTPTDLLHVVMLSDFEKAAAAYLQSDVYHKDLVELPKHEAVPYWQGSGTTFDFADVSKIDVTSGSGNSVTASGILCCMFDDEAVGVSNEERTVRTQYNPKGEYTNYFYKQMEGCYIDSNENMVVFFVA